MRDFAPHIYRQRLVIEGIYTIKISRDLLKECLLELATLLDMTTVLGPIVKDLAGEINPIHKGLEAIVVWAESGAQLYTWNEGKFFTLDIYSCKKYLA